MISFIGSFSRNIFCSGLFFIFLCFGLHPAYAQLFEDFEQGSKGAFAAGTVELETGTWMFDDALIGSRDGDLFFGTRSARIRDGFIEMRFDYPEGASSFSFYGANSRFSGDSGGIVQVYYSINQGGDWQPLGDEIVLTEENELEFYDLPAEISQPVRFKIEKTAGNRVNIDNVLVEPFVELSDKPQISIRKNTVSIGSGSTIELQSVNIGNTSEASFRITNNGEPDLLINEYSFEKGLKFSLAEPIKENFNARESQDVVIQFSSDEPGLFTDRLTIQSNDPDQPEFILDIEARAVDEQELIPISEARDVPFETRVTVGGRVTVANEFEGPSFIQDGTAAIAVLHVPMHSAVERGDSVIVSGPVTEFNPIDGNRGAFLRQISAIPGDSDVQFTIVSDQPEPVEPDVITISQMNAGDYESRLVTIENLAFRAEGVLQGNQNYPISDPTGTGQLRIDASSNQIIGASIPAEPSDVTGVIDRFNGVYQLKPRDIDDIDVQPVEIEGEDIPNDLTFDVVTWNIEWFGVTDRGPDDIDLQMNNVIEVIQTIDADLYAFQEIASRDRFAALVDGLEEYRGFVSNYSQRQQTAYLYRSAVIDSLDAGVFIPDDAPSDWEFNWAGRPPLFFEFNATIDGRTERVFTYNVHAKAFGDEPSYNRRAGAASSFKEYLDENRREDNIIFLGDYNDQLNFSTYNEEVSPYSPFLEDDHYFAVTKSLEDRGFASFLVGQFRSMIDHIIVTNTLIDSHIDGAQRVENTNYIPSYISTTSDHAPVWTRFQFTGEPDEPDGVPVVDAIQSDISSTSPHVADGEDASLVTVVLRDNDGDEIDGVSSNSLSISVEEGDEGSLDIGSFSSTGNTGEFEAEITSTQAGDYEIAVDVDDTRIAGTETIEFTEPSISASSSSVDATSPHLADGSDASTVTVNIVNEIGDSVDDLGNDDFNISLTGSASATNVSNEGGGEYQFEVTNNVVETITVTVTADGTELDDNPEIIFEADEQVDPELSDVSTSDDSADADGEDEIIITVELRNSQNQPINDFDSSDFDIDVSNNGSAADVEQVDDDGTYEFGVTNNQPGTTEIDIEAGGTSLPTVTVEFEEIETFVDGSSSSVEATSPHDADGDDASTVTVTLIDDQGDAMDDVSTGSFDIDVSGNGQVASDVSNEGGGDYEFLVTNNTAETVTVTVTVQGIELDDTPEIVFEEIDIDIPEPPVIGEIVDVDTGIELRWEVGSMDIISEFIIYRGASAGNLEPYATVPTGETTFVDEDPLAGTNFYAISAVNELEEEGDISNLVSFYNGEILSTGDWQMISTPVDGTHSVDSDVTLFSFSNRYEHENSITQGEGYWMKTSDDSSLEFSIRGEGLTQLSLSLNEGWNMVGGLADNIPITSISDTDNVLTDAPVYHYTNGEYVSVDQIEPDKGYWLYASEAGSVDLQIAADQNVTQEDFMASSQTKREVEGEKPALKFSSGNMTAKLEIAENSLSQEQRYAYLLPPLAPEPKLDVRTKDGYRIIGPEGASLGITATQYPVTVNLDDHQAMSDAVYQLVLQKDNRERIVELSSNSPVELMENYDNIFLTTTETTEIIEEHKLLPNYPNPFNPTTTLQYQLSENTHVTLEVYDVSGRRVQVLENGTQQAGLHNAQFDGSNMASGMYMVRFHAGDQVQIQKITLIK